MTTDQDIVDDLTLAIDGLQAIRGSELPAGVSLKLTIGLARLRFLRARLEPVKPGVLVDAEGFVDLTDVTRVLNSDGAIG